MLPKSGHALLGDGPNGEGLGAKMRNCLGFVSTRVLRGRARLIIALVVLVNIIFIVILPGRLSGAVFGDEFGTLLRWRGPGGGHSSGGGGLRIVTFGTPDFGMGRERRNSGSSKSWTEYLCDELRCSSYLSYVPQVDARMPDPALTSNSIYKDAIDGLLAQEVPDDAPGYNYTFLREQYPVPSHADLGAQVQSFLSTRQPKEPPKETLWVFNFGAWDVWNLAALPRESAETVIDQMVLDMFKQIELLYRSSLSDASIAFSDFWGYSSPEVIEKLQSNALGESRSESETFRVLIPKTLDISVSPGWHTQRPQPPRPHSLPVHTTNAFSLTERWNKAVEAHITEWEKLPHPTAEDISPPSRAEARNEKRAAEGAPGAPNDDPSPLYAPFPRRKAFQTNNRDYILDAIIERQMQDTHLVDSKGRGTRSPADPVYFEEVWRPCSGGDDDAVWLKMGGGWRRPCAKPDEYLFQTPFSITGRAMKEVARMAGEEAREKLDLGSE